MSLGRRAYSLKHFIVLYCVLLRLLTSTCAYVGTTKCNVALLRIHQPTIHQPSSINHQPATKSYSIPFNSWWNGILILTMICASAHYFAVHLMDLDSQNLPRTPYVNGDPSLSQSISPLPNPYLPTSKPYLQLPKPSQGNAHAFLSWIVAHRGWWWWNTMGFYFKMLDRLLRVGGTFHKTSITYKSLGHYHKALALGYRRDLRYTKRGENLWSTIIIKPSGPLYKVL